MELVPVIAKARCAGDVVLVFFETTDLLEESERLLR
jgi:hypothetical protein